MRKYVLTLFFAIITLSYSYTQEKLEADLLKEDLRIIGDIAIGLSPKLSGEDKTRIDQLIRKKQEELEGKSLTSPEFFNFLSEINFRTRFDEHASLSLAGDAVIPLLNASKLFPLPIKIIENTIAVNTENGQLPFGSKIYSVNGIAMDSLLSSFSRHYEATFTRRRMELQFSLIYLIKKGSFEQFQVEYSLPSDPGIRLRKSIDGIDFETYNSVFNEIIFPLKQERLENLINTEFLEESNTYYLQLNSFNWDNSAKKGLLHFLNTEHKNFEKRFTTLFREITNTNAENLIIDLRFNQGGNVKVPAVLYSFLTAEPFSQEIRITIPDFEIPNIELINRISRETIEDEKEVKKFIRLYEKQFAMQGDSMFVWNLVENEKIQPSPNAFKGKVYLLVSGRSISSAAYFAALFKSHKRGLIVGEEMGGSYRSLSAGQILAYTIPNSKIELEAPIMEVNFSDQLYQTIQREKILPDLQFSEEDRYRFFLEKKDIELEKILEMINKN